jgi:hypothetical protein
MSHIKNATDLAFDNNVADMQSEIESALQYKIINALEQKRIEIAMGILQTEAESCDDEDMEDDEDEESSDDEEKEDKKKKKSVKEDTINELSKKTLGSYVKKASHDVGTYSAATGRHSERSQRALERDKKNKMDNTDYEDARKNSKIADKAFAKSWKRREGISKAVDKITKE